MISSPPLRLFFLPPPSGLKRVTWQQDISITRAKTLSDRVLRGFEIWCSFCLFFFFHASRLQWLHKKLHWVTLNGTFFFCMQQVLGVKVQCCKVIWKERAHECMTENFHITFSYLWRACCVTGYLKMCFFPGIGFVFLRSLKKYNKPSSLNRSNILVISFSVHFKSRVSLLSGTRNLIKTEQHFKNSHICF